MLKSSQKENWASSGCSGEEINGLGLWTPLTPLNSFGLLWTSLDLSNRTDIDRFCAKSCDLLANRLAMKTIRRRNIEVFDCIMRIVRSSQEFQFVSPSERPAIKKGGAKI